MVAAPQYFTMKFLGLATGQTYVKDGYFSDVANGLARFDGGIGASATSPDWLTFPEPVVLQDYSVVTGLTDTTKCLLTLDGRPTGDILRASIHLTTLANRPALNILVAAGVKFGAIQLA